jgi:hypothetical protein
MPASKQGRLLGSSGNRTRRRTGAGGGLQTTQKAAAQQRRYPVKYKPPVGFRGCGTNKKLQAVDVMWVVPWEWWPPSPPPKK